MATSTITGTITDPSGVAVAGAAVSCTLMPAGGFRSADGSEVARTVNTTTNASGVYTLVLERNSGITPANTYYEINEQVPAAQGGVQVWRISVGASNQTVLAALVATPPAAAASAYLTQAAGDARYQALGALSSNTPQIDSQTAGAAGVSTTGTRDDHQHQQAAATPRGTMGQAQATVNQTPVTTEVDATSLTTTFTAVVGRRYRVSGYCGSVTSSVANDVARISIKEGATLMQVGQATVPTAFGPTISPKWEGTLSAGSHTIKLTYQRVSGTGNLTFNADPTFPAFILVEDIGT